MYYSLSGLMLAMAPDVRQASESVFASLHTLIGKMGAEGVRTKEANEVRFGDLEIEIDSVEAIEFPV